MNIGEPNENFWAHWSNIEWLISGIIACGTAISVFVWRLSVKVLLLEHKLEMTERDQSQRHAENVHLQRGVQMRIDGLASRIDRWFGRHPSGNGDHG
jgi:hypothetical protein